MHAMKDQDQDDQARPEIGADGQPRDDYDEEGPGQLPTYGIRRSLNTSEEPIPGPNTAPEHLLNKDQDGQARPEIGADGDQRDDHDEEGPGPGQLPTYGIRRSLNTSEEPIPGGHTAPAGNSGSEDQDGQARPEIGADGQQRDDHDEEGPGQLPTYGIRRLLNTSEEPIPGGHTELAKVPRQGDLPWFTLLLATYKDSAKPIDGNGRGHQPRAGKNRVCKDRLLNKVYTNPKLAEKFYPSRFSDDKIKCWARWLPIQRTSNPRFQTNVFIVFLSDWFYPKMSLVPADLETLQMLHPTNAGYEPAFQFVVAVDSNEKVQDFKDHVQYFFSLEKQREIELETVGELVLNFWQYHDASHSHSFLWDFQGHPKETCLPVPPAGAILWPF